VNFYPPLTVHFMTLTFTLDINMVKVITDQTSRSKVISVDRYHLDRQTQKPAHTTDQLLDLDYKMVANKHFHAFITNVSPKTTSNSTPNGTHKFQGLLTIKDFFDN